MKKEEHEGIEELFNKADRDKFYGEIVFQFRHGDLVMIRKTETIPPDSLFKNRRTAKEKHSVRKQSPTG
jgi:hypothetical protein